MDSPRIIKLSPFDLYGIRKVYIRIHSAVTHLWLSVRWWNFKFPSSIPRKSCPSRKADKGTGHKPAGMYLYLYLSLLRRMLRMLNPKLGMMPPLSVLFLVSLNFSWFFMCLSAERKLSPLSSHFPHFSPEFSHRISERWPPSNLRLSGGIRNGTKMTFANNRFPFPNRIIYAAPIKVKLFLRLLKDTDMGMGFHICLLNISAWPSKGHRW